MSRPSQPAGDQTQQGFSLVEMLVVLAILALVSALYVPSLRQGGRERSPEAVAYELHALFFRARTNAISRGDTEAMLIDVPNRRVSYISAKRSVAIPENLRPNLLVGRELLAEDGAAALLFYPDGGSTGATLTFTDRRNLTAGVVVPWLTGIPVVMRAR